MQTNTNTLLEWQAPTRSDRVRSDQWYAIGGALCAVMIAYGILSGSWSLSLIFALVPALYYVLRNKSHSKHTIRLKETGIEYDGRLTPWAEWKEFWILEGTDYYELHIAAVRTTRSELVIQTGEIDPYAIRDALGQYIPQIAHQKERLLDAIIRFCKL
jgi:hypothetical protein